ncbi:MAG TPA: hypothetical protein DD412_08590, partial [Holosporales bacterium]|nr:hypothetical protein [Holosporales bacterium]
TAIRAGVNTVLKSTIDGRNFGEVLAEEARSGAASVVGGTLANQAGIQYKAQDSDINYVMHKIIHGVIGGVSGLVSGGSEEAFASAIGATIGEIVGEGYEKAHHGGVYDPDHPSFNAKEREDMVKKGTMFSELSAAVFAGVLGQDPNAAARAARTAVTENSFAVKLLLKAGKELFKKGAKEGTKKTVKEAAKKEVKETAKKTAQQTMKKEGRSGKQQRLKEMMKDDKLGKSDRGWLKNDARHIKTGNKKALRVPRNGRKAPGRKAKDKGYELAHPHNEPASQGNSYASAKLKGARDHKVETRLHQHRYKKG